MTDFLKAQFFWSFGCNGTEGAKKGKEQKCHESKELFTILKLFIILSAKIV